MTIAEYIAGQLVESGVKYVFGIPGGPSIPYIEAFRKAGIEFILTSHESAAAVMADVTARLTGVPGVCHATFGPGATNISTGTGGALLDRSPVIVITSEMPEKMLKRTAQMNIDHQRLFEPVTKATYRITQDNLVEVMAEALRICYDEYPGPVHLGLPSDIAGIVINEISVPVMHQDVPVDNDESEKGKIIDLLGKTRHPIIALGLTAARFGLKKRINDFLDSCRIPVVLTPMAKGLVPEDHRSYTGVLFHALSDYMEDIYQKTDLVIGIGYDPVEYNYESWLPDVPLIHFDTVRADMPDDREIYQYTGLPEEWFRILGNINSGSISMDASVIRGIRDEMTAVFDGFLGHFGPVSVLHELKSSIPPDTIITADVGSHLHLIGQYWPVGAPDRLVITNGWSSMGFGIPAAVAAKLARPETPVICLTGDGGFLMSAGEIVTARRNKLAIIIVVFSDGELNLIRLKQSWKDLHPYATQIYSGDLFGTDAYLGVRVLKAENSEKMRESIETALGLNEPVIINAIIDPDDYKWLVVKQI